MNVAVLADQQEFILINTVRTQDVVWTTCRERWLIETNGERETERERERERERENQGNPCWKRFLIMIMSNSC